MGQCDFLEEATKMLGFISLGSNLAPHIAKDFSDSGIPDRSYYRADVHVELFAAF